MSRYLLPALLILTAAARPAAAQATFHGDNARTGVYGSAGPRTLGGVKWSYATGGPVLASPAVAGGIVFVGSEDGSFYAIEQDSGRLKWKFETKRPISSSAAVANGVVFFNSYDGNLYALDAGTGALRWKFAARFERRFEAKAIHGNSPREQTIPDAWDFFASSPAVYHDRVYFGSGDHNVYALNAQTGALEWKFATGGVVHSSPSVADQTVFIGSWDSILYALDADTGAERWRFKAGEDTKFYNQVGFTSSAAVAGGGVYVGCRDGHVYALDAKTGKQMWSYATEGAWVSATPAIDGDTLYVATGSSLQFLALDVANGKPRFVYDMKVGGFSSAALAGGLAYVGNFNGRLYAFDAAAGKPVWEFQTESSKKDPLHVLNADGSWNQDSLGAATFFDFQDMYVTMYRRFSVGAILSSPAVDGGAVYFGSTDGRVYALQ